MRKMAVAVSEIHEQDGGCHELTTSGAMRGWNQDKARASEEEREQHAHEARPHTHLPDAAEAFGVLGHVEVLEDDSTVGLHVVEDHLLRRYHVRRTRSSTLQPHGTKNLDLNPEPEETATWWNPATDDATRNWHTLLMKRKEHNRNVSATEANTMQGLQAGRRIDRQIDGRGTK